jgi:anti-sigma B factor antagonist
MTLHVEVRVEPDGAAALVLAGELDLAVSDELGRLLAAALAQSVRIRLDLAQVTFMDCAVLGVLVLAARQAEAAGGRLGISDCSPLVQRLLALTSLDGVLGVDA